MKFVLGALLLAGVMLASTGSSQAQSIFPWNWGMNECKAGYKYDSKRNVCVSDKKGKKKVAKKSGKKKKKTA